MAFLHGQGLSEAIQELAASGRMDIAVAFWGGDACEKWLRIPRTAQGWRVACDARSGACNPSAIDDLLARQVSIVDVPGLHAKVYIGENGAVTSSANASANGLGEQGLELSIGLEAGYLFREHAEIESARNWFEGIFKRGRPVTKTDLPHIRELWEERWAHRPVRLAHRSFWEVLLNDPAGLDERGLKVFVGNSYNPPKKIEDKYLHYGYSESENNSFYWDAQDWQARLGDYILEFLREDDIVSFSSVWRVQAVIEDGLIIPVERVSKPFRLRLSRADMGDIEDRVRSAIDKRILLLDGRPLSIGDFCKAVAR
jgi:hypothetical protein